MATAAVGTVLWNLYVSPEIVRSLAPLSRAVGKYVGQSLIYFRMGR
jgi:hypothetical protein